VHAGHEILIELGDHILLIVNKPQGILDQQLRDSPNPFKLIVFNKSIVFNYVLFKF
jgi:hypothetical protein